MIFMWSILIGFTALYVGTGIGLFVWMAWNLGEGEIWNCLKVALIWPFAIWDAYRDQGDI